MEINGIYKCNICGNIVEMTHVGGGTLVCCGQPMDHMKENTTNAAEEKHVPVIERRDDGVSVKIGAVPHPMETGHHIEWIELVADGIVYKCFLGAGQKPEFFFETTAKHVEARAYCNLHGLWKG